MTAMGIIAFVLACLAGVLWIPAIWVPVLTLFVILFAAAALVLGYYAHKLRKTRLPMMQQFAAQTGRPFRPPFDFGELSMLIAGLALLITLILFSYSFSLFQVAGYVGNR